MKEKARQKRIREVLNSQEWAELKQLIQNPELMKALQKYYDVFNHWPNEEIHLLKTGLFGKNKKRITKQAPIPTFDEKLYIETDPENFQIVISIALGLNNYYDAYNSDFSEPSSTDSFTIILKYFKEKTKINRLSDWQFGWMPFRQEQQSELGPNIIIPGEKVFNNLTAFLDYLIDKIAPRIS
jgi:hypothetical protein